MGQNYTPVGYEALIKRYDLWIIPHFRKSFIAQQGRNKTSEEQGIELHIYGASHALKDPQK